MRKREKVYPRVVGELLERVEKGIDTYGEVLTTFNGRSALQDLKEELIDALMYVTQLQMEADDPEASSAQWVAALKEDYGLAMCPICGYPAVQHRESGPNFYTCLSPKKCVPPKEQ